MDRFHVLVQKKITGQLCDGEAIELDALLQQDRKCQLIFQTLFFTTTDASISNAKAQEALAKQLKMIMR